MFIASFPRITRWQRPKFRHGSPRFGLWGFRESKSLPSARSMVVPAAPPRPKPPKRSDYADDAKFGEAVAKHKVDVAERQQVMEDRRKIAEQLREKGRDRSKRVRPADDGARATQHRQQNGELVERHREREAQRHAASLLRCFDPSDHWPSRCRGHRA